MIRLRRGYRRGPRNPWDYSIDDFRNRRFGLILVRRVFDLRILVNPFVCPQPSPRRGRREVDEDTGQLATFSIT
jgi:hypothetical protein